MSSTVTGAAATPPRPAAPTIAAPVRPAGPDPRLKADYDWGTDSEIGIAIAHIKAWLLAREHANSQVPKG